MLIAHLSDTHLCLENGGRRQRRVIVDLIRSALNRGAEHFLVSGDIVEYCNHRDLQLFFRDIQRVGVKPNQLSVLPGNHDIFPVSPKRLWRSLFRFAKHRRYYERFFFLSRDFFGEILQRKPLIYFRKINESHVLFAVDTNDYQARNHRQSGRGRINEEAIEAIEQAIKKYGFENHHKILMIHHFPFRWGDGLSVEVDFTDVEGAQKLLTRHDWTFIACGHSHRNSGTRRIGKVPVVNSASNPGRDHYICSLIDTDNEIIPKRLETNLNRRIRMVFSRHQRE